MAWHDRGRSLRRLALRAHVAALALAFPPLATWLPLARLLAAFTPSATWRLYRGLTPVEVARIVQSRLRHPWVMRKRRCLREGLLIYHVLRLAGVPAVLNFAVYRFDQPRSLAHCWVTVGGECLTAAAPAPSALVLIYPE